jgi:NAD(P)-dependent dehydrogenase (short-subunit alcohol dehydrogenase family)
MSFVDLRGRTSIVTGAAGGIGRAVCEELARAGSGVALFDLEGAKADEVAGRVANAFGIAAETYDLRR